jgi:hypothetical protein
MVGKGIKSCGVLAYRLVSIIRGKLAAYLIWMKANVGLLTDDIILQAPTREKPYTIRDGRGLFVLVHPNGSRYFQMRATVAGKRKLMQLGVYPQISIEEARALSSGRLQAELEEAESGLPTGALDESASLFMAPAPNVTEAIAAPLRVEEPTAAVTSKFIPKEVTKLKEDRHITKLDDDMDLFEEKPRGPTPKVNLAYDQLVYIPSTLPKTFSQKFAARYHPRVLLLQLIQSSLDQSDKFKMRLVNFSRSTFQQRLKVLRRYHKISQIFINNQLINIENLLTGIKTKWVKLKLKDVNFRLKKPLNMSFNISGRDGIKLKLSKFCISLTFDLMTTYLIVRYLDEGLFDWHFYTKIYLLVLSAQIVVAFRSRLVSFIWNCFNRQP